MKKSINLQVIMGCFLIFGLLMVNAGFPPFRVGKFGSETMKLPYRVDTRMTLPEESKISLDIVIIPGLLDSGLKLAENILKNLAKDDVTAKKMYNTYKEGKRRNKLCNFAKEHVNLQDYKVYIMMKLEDIHNCCSNYGDQDDDQPSGFCI
ncbi:hypothetical protein BVRB_2g047830 [Beta vulgaris subsp. vulgaris]|uniref:Uncharacterized protein n=1 Tax=Beta vulgaris subsp. vulgaris TaxID=3555 RepID=A0A0J8BDX5_BETVV|nr:hypothetical protein BVRB_2g047830 [Beta vulgaris subsp. vulgaris]